MKVERYAYDVGFPEVLQFVFYYSVLQEAIRLNIVSLLIIQDLTKNLEEFNWESFEVWLDFISADLVACQDKEPRGGAPPRDGAIESSKSLSLPIPYSRGVHVKGPTKPLSKEK